MRSLVDLSIKTLAKNIEETSVEALEHLPVEILWRVYKYHATKCQPSIRAWRLFCPILARDRERLPVTLYSFWWQEKNPAAHDLKRYVELSTSSSVDFITHLTLHKVWMYNSADLMALADMPNLGVLELSDLFGKEQHDPVEVRPDVVTSVLNDRLVRGWSEKERPFPVLRVLLITSVHSSITTLSLQYVSRFPSLMYCSLRSTSLSEFKWVGLEREVKKACWRMERKLTPWREIKDRIIWHERQHDRRDRTTRIKDFESSPRTGVFLSPSSSAAGSTGTQTGHQSSLFDDFPAEANAPFLIPRISVQPPPRPPWRLYSTLGEKSANADLLHQGVPLPRTAWTAAALDGAPPPELSLDEFKGERQEIPLPPKPTLNVELGTPRDDYVDAHKDPVYYFPGDYDHALARRRNGNKFMVEITCSRDYSTTMTTPTPASSGSRKRRRAPGRYIRPRKKRDNSSNFNFETG
ncbi:hypothetical protein GE09DRAFT_1229189 [Coniochaeta sp. 2T2.1]|nr:hypothetical protein GE09DRAFT_1229189 [Coniochaeta sp. 2T2.1]